MDECEVLLTDIWQNWKPYNRASNDKWRSYIIGNSEADLLGTDEDCVTLVNSNSGLYVQ
jgi:hypothetical protein